ncbi:carboxylesterase SOBER1-like [Diospyros lotus]|uniref:carboxylesterase SOBER1-like n=1 Tax=Diospyros lotus TaxID=55363 RepID=UPI002256C182|nr:carboxylesterase SOBER1-like [Diospyros lotus]
MRRSRCALLAKPVALLAVTFATTIFVAQWLSQFQSSKPLHSAPRRPASAGRRFVLWLHGLGDSGSANEPLEDVFTSPELRSAAWSFPSAPASPVTCYGGSVMPSWFDILELPITVDSRNDEDSVLKAVWNVHAMIDKEVAAGTNPDNIFVSGFSQGGALTLASVLLYPKTLGGGAVFAGWIPFNSSVIERIPPDAKRTPILWSHGTSDRTVFFEAGQAGLASLKRAGLSCEFKAYQGLGHELNKQELSYMESWIKARLQGSS